MMRLRVGASRIDITPLEPVPLSGFGHRQGPFAGISAPIHARAVVLETCCSETGEQRLGVVVSVDLIWIGEESVDRIARQCASRWGIPQELCLIAATHSHGGPQTVTRFTSSLGSADIGYIAYMEDRIVLAVAQAIDGLEEAIAETGSGFCDMGIHRRRQTDEGVVMAPNPEGPVDREVRVVRFVSANESRTLCVFVHFSCHPTTSDQQRLSDEFPGYAMRLLEREARDDAVCLFLQGFCGDIRPNLVRDGEFYRGGQQEIEAFGKLLAGVVSTTLSQSMRPLPIAMLRGAAQEVPLPFQPGIAANALHLLAQKDGVASEWARLLLERGIRSEANVRLQALVFSSELMLLGAGAEMMCAYGQWLKEQSGGRCLPVGYTGGIVGYVPTSDMLDEGGYEATGSYRYFALEGPFAKEIEARIKEAMSVWLREFN